MLRKTMVVLAIGFALGGGSTLSISAFARDSAFRANGGYGDRVGNFHHGRLRNHGRGYGWSPLGPRGYDPWGHWGA